MGHTMTTNAGASAVSFNITDPKHLIAFGFGAGLSPMAPGTVGTVVGVLLYLVLSMLPTLAYMAVVAGLFAAGMWAIGAVAESLGEDDPQVIVWDEIVGFLIAMIAAPAGIAWIILGFVIFRAFDIKKPWPIGAVELGVKGPLGIMLDDVIAGIYTWLVLHGLWMMVEASLRGGGGH
jgi:phosphatidylglycerophosphatase A